MLCSPTTQQGNRAPINPTDLDPRTWIFQPKFDGFRILAHWDGTGWLLLTRSGKPFRPPTDWWTSQVGFPRTELVLDGEIVADRFTDLSGWMKAPTGLRPKGLRFVAFDLLHYGVPLLDVTLEQRLEMLRTGVPHGHQAGRWTYAEAMGMAAEGAVGKRLASPYVPGARSRDWLKFKRVNTVTCVAYRHSPEGKRAWELAVPIDGVMTPIGSVGSGVTDQLFGATALPAVIEIKAEGRTASGVRFPRFHRTRPDVDVVDIDSAEYLALREY